MKKFNFKPILVLSTICLTVALLLSLINSVTSPIIEKNQNAAANEALLELLPDGKDFKELIIDGTYPKVITQGYKADGGYIFTAVVAGKSTGLTIMCSLDEAGKIVATKVLASQETVSYAEKVFPSVQGNNGKYTGMTYDTFEPFLVSGATLTSAAYGEAIKAILQAYTVASGGEVDIRTPEEILQDNCNAAAGTQKLTYTKWFATEALVGIDAVYTAPDTEVLVYVVGESFIGVNASGEIVTADIDTATATTVLAAHALASASTLTEITERPEGIHKDVTKIFVTASGNYVMEIKAEGFSTYYYEEWGYGTDTPIVIRVSISADGKIIDCQTVSHDESKGYGDKCATDAYYETFRGTESTDIVISQSPIKGDVTDPGAIAGATFTTQGYQKAIQRAFNAFEILTGGDQNG